MPSARARRTALVLVGLGLATLAALGPGHALAADATPASCPSAAEPIDTERFRSGLRDAAVDHGFLWRIERGGRSSYLYGTIHVAQPEWMFPGPLTKKAIAAVDTVALELDVLDPSVPLRLAQSVQSRPGETLPAELVRRIDARMAAECMDPARWRGFAPEFQIALLATMAARREGFDSAYAIDGVLAVAARTFAKSVVSLETPESQMAALRAPTREAMLELVRSSLDDLDSGRAGPLVVRLVRAWNASDLTTLEDYERWCECERNDAERQTMKVLLDDRNVALAAQIDAMHAGGHAVFAAVGSLHMIGPKGLPALMRERGFRVELVVPGH
jgi:uncharacterized protein